MTPAQFRTRVYDLLGLPTTHPTIEAPDLNNFLHEGLLQMCWDALPWTLYNTTAINLTNNSAGVLLPLNVMVIQEIKAKGKVLRYAERVELSTIRQNWETANSASIQTHWYNTGVETTAGANYGKRRIGVYPRPAGNSANGLLLTYIRKPHAVGDMANSANEIVDVPVMYHDALAHYAAARALSQHTEEGDPRKIQAYFSVFERARQMFVAECNAYDLFSMRRSRLRQIDAPPGGDQDDSAGVPGGGA